MLDRLLDLLAEGLDHALGLVAVVGSVAIVVVGHGQKLGPMAKCLAKGRLRTPEVRLIAE